MLVLRPDLGSSTRVSDAWVTTWGGDVFYIVESCPDQDEDDGGRMRDNGRRRSNFFAHPVVTQQFSLHCLEENIELPWGMVGVWRFNGVDRSKRVALQRKDIRGKVMKCNDVLSEWLVDWFMSKTDQ